MLLDMKNPLEQALNSLTKPQSVVLKDFISKMGQGDEEAFFLAGLKAKETLKSCESFMRGSKLEYCLRILMGRALFILKHVEGLNASQLSARLSKSTQESLTQKTLERHLIVYKRVAENSNLRFAWGGHFDALSKNGGQFKKAVTKYKLDFGGPAPFDEISFGRRKTLCVLPDWFCLFHHKRNVESETDVPQRNK
jgi:hypothetical protein